MTQKRYNMIIMSDSNQDNREIPGEGPEISGAKAEHDESKDKAGLLKSPAADVKDESKSGT